MTNLDQPAFREIIVGTAGAFASYMPAETIAVYFKDLRAYDLKDIDIALSEFRNDATQKQMPTPGMIKALINSKHRKPFTVEGEKQPVPPKEFFDEVHKIIDESPKLPYDPTKSIAVEVEPKEEKEIPEIKPVNDTDVKDWEENIKKVLST